LWELEVSVKLTEIHERWRKVERSWHWDFIRHVEINKWRGSGGIGIKNRPSRLSNGFHNFH
jgi:hypothetical protein